MQWLSSSSHLFRLVELPPLASAPGFLIEKIIGRDFR